MNAIEPLTEAQLKELLGEKEILISQLIRHIQKLEKRVEELEESTRGGA